jgi:hypothetical protein
VLRGLDGLMTPDEARSYFGVISEMQPIATWQDACAHLADGALTVALALVIAWRTRSLLWGYVALCGGVVVVLGLSHTRFATYAAILAAAALPLALTYCTRSLAKASATAQSFARMAVLFLFFLLPRTANAVHLLSPAAPAENLPSCSLLGIDRMLGSHAGAVVLADITDTPELLYRTRIATVGSLYTNIAGFMRARAAWRSMPADDLPETVRATKASLLLFCPKPRSLLVSDLPPDTLADRLGRHDAPRWLEKIDEDAASGNVLYRIVGAP